jgi:molecular chaperone DnaK (HSP70)
LGGDDFDRLILEHFLAHIRQEYRVDLRENLRAMNRLNHAAEAAKIELSAHPYVHVVEEDLAPCNGRSVHLDLELSRDQYETMIRSMIDRTVECVHQALRDARLTPSQVDRVLLVGGSTRTPLVQEVLKDLFQKEPRSELHPDICVAMGAAILAARIQGTDVDQILVDITAHSFGVASVSLEDGWPNPYHFSRIINRNTPLPVTRSEEFETLVDNQKIVEVNVYQGEEDDVRYDTKIGTFRVEGLSKVPAGNKVIGRMSLDLNGILTVTAVEKSTGLTKSITIEGAYQAKDAREIIKARTRLVELFPSSLQGDLEKQPGSGTSEDVAASGMPKSHMEVLKRARAAFDRMHPDDRKEAEELCAQIEQLAAKGEDYDEPLTDLQELMYFVGA